MLSTVFNRHTVVLSDSGLSLQGLSFLDLRYHLLLFYLQDLTHLINIKTEGGKIKDSEALNRVITIRTVRFHNNKIVYSYVSS